VWDKLMQWIICRYSSATLAIDLQESEIKIIEISPLASGPVITHSAMNKLPAGVIQQGNIYDIPALSEAITELLPANRARHYYVRLSIEDEWATKRQWTVSTKVKPHEIPALIRVEAGKWVDFPAEDVFFDYQILKQEPLAKEYSILVVLCPSLLILSRQHLFESLGMTVQSIELASSVLARLPYDLGDWRLVYALVNGRKSYD